MAVRQGELCSKGLPQRPVTVEAWINSPLLSIPRIYWYNHRQSSYYCLVDPILSVAVIQTSLIIPIP
jgi:hypothetical protein